MATIRKTGIPWATHAWPVYVGCKRGCTIETCGYDCYAKRIFDQYGHYPEMDGKFENVSFIENNFNMSFPKKPGARIFMCPSTDPEYWEDEGMQAICGKILAYPQHTFIILTKDEIVYWRWEHTVNKLKNLWLGLTINHLSDMKKVDIFKTANDINNIKFLSLEPIREKIPFELFDFDLIDWLIVGGQSGPGEKFYPDSTYIHGLVRECRINKTPLFIKPNLKVKICGRIENYSEEWGAIQQYPEVKR
jgi:protein gp37